MPMQSKVSVTRGTLSRMCALLVVATFGFVGWTYAQGTAEQNRIYVVTHVDIAPPGTAAGTALVKQYVADSRKDKGFVRIEAGAQISRTNHITFVEVWQNQKAFDEHIAAAHTRQFRQQIEPM